MSSSLPPWKLASLGACALLLAVLVGSIVHASLESNVVEGLRVVLAERWGVATMIDLVVGLVLVAAWIVVTEPRRGLAALLVVLLCLLGNVTTLAYLVVRIVRAQAPGDLLRRR